MPRLTVYFTCRECERLYLTSQQRGRSPGWFDCQACGKPVHQWSGPYDFTGWHHAVAEPPVEARH